MADLPLEAITRALVRELSGLCFAAPVAYVYRPLEYAGAVHREFLRRYARGPKKYLMVGMNPGPWGMAQTGIPFGAVSLVRDWLGLRELRMERPAEEHVRRPVLGFACGREEVSGRRLWGWARDTYGTPESFFEAFWVTNYCPLLFLDREGRNLTPDRLHKEDRELLQGPCDRALAGMAAALEVELIVAIGAWAERRATAACSDLPLEIGRILHPSPASPAANRGWAEIAESQLRDLGVELPGFRVGYNASASKD